MSRVNNSGSNIGFVSGGAKETVDTAEKTFWTLSGVLTAVALVVSLAAFFYILGVHLHYRNDWNDIDDNDDRLDDLFKHVDPNASRLDFEKDVTFEQDVMVEGTITANSFASCPAYPVCSGGSTVAGQAVSLNDNCVTNGFDPYPSFTYRAGDDVGDDHDLNVALSIDGANTVVVKRDPDAFSVLKLFSLRLDGNTYAEPVAPVVVGSGIANSWGAAVIGDGSTVFVVRPDSADADIDLYRCTVSDSAISCDSGVEVLDAADLTILDLHYAGSVGADHLLVVLYVDGSDQLSTLAFTATTVADAALVGVGPAVVIDTDSSYAGDLGFYAEYHGKLVDLQGTHSDYAFGIVYGGVDSQNEINLVVHTLGTSPVVATPTQTVVSGGVHTFTTPDVDDDQDVELWASTVPGTNEIAVLTRSFQDDEPATVFTVAVTLNAAQTAVVYATGAGQGTVVQYSPDATFGSDAYNYRIECLSTSVCIVAYRGRGALFDYGLVSVVEIGSGAVIKGLRDRAVFAASEPKAFNIVPVNAGSFALVFSEQTIGAAGDSDKIALAELAGTNKANSEIHFGLTSKGQSPLGIAQQTCAAGSSCQICIAGVYELPAASPLADLKHVSPVYAYPSGALGLSPLVPGVPLEASAQIATHVGFGRVIVRSDGLFTPR